MAAVILVHSWPPAHGCCPLPSLPPGAPRGDGLPTCHSGGHCALRDLGHYKLPMEKQRRALAPSPPAPAGALMGVHQGEPGGQEKRGDGEVAAQSLHKTAHMGKALSSLHSCLQTPLNCNPRAEASPLARAHVPSLWCQILPWGTLTQPPPSPLQHPSLPEVLPGKQRLSSTKCPVTNLVELELTAFASGEKLNLRQMSSEVLSRAQ